MTVGVGVRPLPLVPPYITLFADENAGYQDYSSDPRYDRLSGSDQKSVRSLQKRINEHIDKLKAYRANPDAFDNQGHLKNAPSQAVRERIINTRISHLQKEIQTFKNQVENILRKSTHED